MSALPNTPDPDRLLMDRVFSRHPFPPPDKPYRTVAQTAEYLGLPERFILRLIERGQPDGYCRPGVGLVIYDDDLERAIEEGAEWAARNPGVPQLNHRDKWEPDTRDYATELLYDPCCYCGAPTEHIDHIVARINGGEHDWPNLTAACQRCNSIKGRRTLLTFLLRRRER